jgi:hypothetical protein
MVKAGKGAVPNEKIRILWRIWTHSGAISLRLGSLRNMAQ